MGWDADVLRTTHNPHPGSSVGIGKRTKSTEESDMNDLTTTVEIADHTGHTTLQLNKQETMDVVRENQNAWIFAGDKLVQPHELEAADWNTVGTVRVMPGLVGGLA